ncbi:hypothetical protein [Flavobacterium sp.]|uniref:hypothetical protein n=1 Tax=Flavobacterium sp. TaxID=239 RepID=UPI003B9CAB2E
MGIKKYISAVILSAFFLGCGNSDEVTPEEPQFSLYINGELSAYKFDKAIQDGDMIYLIESNFYNQFPILSKGTMSFDKFGRLGQITIEAQTAGINRVFRSFRHFSLEYFESFNVNYDSINQRVTGTFSGLVYYDPENIQSETKYINGSFNLPVRREVVPLAGLSNKCKLNGQIWSSTFSFITKLNESSFDKVALNCVNNDKYKIAIKFDRAEENLGLFPFTDSTFLNSVVLSVYDVEQNQYVNYNCTGQLDISQRAFNTIRGTYNFTAVNPTDESDVIVVSEGAFFLDYPPFS